MSSYEETANFKDLRDCYSGDMPKEGVNRVKKTKAKLVKLFFCLVEFMTAGGWYDTGSAELEDELEKFWIRFDRVFMQGIGKELFETPLWGHYFECSDNWDEEADILRLVFNRLKPAYVHARRNKYNVVKMREALGDSAMEGGSFLSTYIRRVIKKEEKEEEVIKKEEKEEEVIKKEEEEEDDDDDDVVVVEDLEVKKPEVKKPEVKKAPETREEKAAKEQKKRSRDPEDGKVSKKMQKVASVEVQSTIAWLINNGKRGSLTLSHQEHGIPNV
eukprot:3936802-Rhodomonas_salina.1